MLQTEIIVDVIQGQLLVQAVLAFAEGRDTSPDGGHMLADGQVETLDECRVDLPAMSREHLLDRLQRAEHDAVCHVDQAPAPYGLDYLRIEQPGQWHPARFRHR